MSATGSWSERVREYHDASAFVASVREWWGHTEAPARIVTDDYGLAAQVAFAWKPGHIVLDVPDDPIQPRPRAEHAIGTVLWLWRSDTWAAGRDLPAARGRVAHPTARGDSVWVSKESRNRSAETGIQ